MGWSNAELKAIGRYATSYDYKLSLGAKPYAQFIDKNGKEIKVHILTITAHFQMSLKEESTERRRVKTQEKRNAQNKNWRTSY
jgi:hypothetical protein